MITEELFTDVVRICGKSGTVGHVRDRDALGSSTSEAALRDVLGSGTASVSQFLKISVSHIKDLINTYKIFGHTQKT